MTTRICGLPPKDLEDWELKLALEDAFARMRALGEVMRSHPFGCEIARQTAQTRRRIAMLKFEQSTRLVRAWGRS